MADNERMEYLKGKSDGYDEGYRAAMMDYTRGIQAGRRQMSRVFLVIVNVQTIILIALAGRTFGWW